MTEVLIAIAVALTFVGVIVGILRPAYRQARGRGTMQPMNGSDQ